MAIEAIGSVMSAQVIQPKPVVQAPKQTVEAVEGATAEAVKVDRNISVVEETQSKGDSDSQTGNQQTNQQVSNEQLKKAVEKLNKSMANSEAVFGFHEGTHRVTIKIVDKETKEVIKELPPEKTLDMIAKVWELAGILVDERR